MSRDGVDGNVQGVSDGLVGESFGNTYYDFLFALAQDFCLVFGQLLIFPVRTGFSFLLNIAFKTFHSRNEYIVFDKTMRIQIGFAVDYVK